MESKGRKKGAKQYLKILVYHINSQILVKILIFVGLK